MQSSKSLASQWDSGGVIDILHAVSDELMLDRLSCILVESAVEHSGAMGDSREVTIRRALVTVDDLPNSILRRV